MNYSEFKQRFERARTTDPTYTFLREELGLQETPDTDADIDRAERELNAKLPVEYILFLKDYGGGLVGGFDICSAKAESTLDIVRYQVVPDFVAITGDGCGNDYGFIVQNGQCQPAIVFWEHEEEKFEPTEWETVLDFLLFAVGVDTEQ
jgi:hypothetical protein